MSTFRRGEPDRRGRPAGRTEVWTVRNAAGTPHNFHLHGVSFAVLDYAGEQPPQHLSGLKDTVYVPPNETVTLLVRFPDYPDPESPYMFHCHMLQPTPWLERQRCHIPGQQTGSSAAKKNSVSAEQMA